MSDPRKSEYPFTPPWSAEQMPNAFSFDEVISPASVATTNTSEALRTLVDNHDNPGIAALFKHIQNDRVTALGEEYQRLFEHEVTARYDDKVAHEAQLKSDAASLENRVQSERTNLRKLEADLEKATIDLAALDLAAAQAYAVIGEHWAIPSRDKLSALKGKVDEEFLKRILEQLGGEPHKLNNTESDPEHLAPASILLGSTILGVARYEGLELEEKNFPASMQAIIRQLDKRRFSPLLEGLAKNLVTVAVGTLLGLTLGLAAQYVTMEDLNGVTFSQSDVSNSIGDSVTKWFQHSSRVGAFVAAGVAISIATRAAISSTFLMVGESIAYLHPAFKAFCKSNTFSKDETIDNSIEASIYHDSEMPTTTRMGEFDNHPNSNILKSSWLQSAEKAGKVMYIDLIRSAKGTLVIFAIIGVVMIALLLSIDIRVEGVGLLQGLNSSLEENFKPGSTDPSHVYYWIGALFVTPYFIYSMIEGIVRGRDNVYENLLGAWNVKAVFHTLEQYGITTDSVRTAYETRNKANLKRGEVNDLTIQTLALKQWIIGAEMQKTILEHPSGNSLTLESRARLTFAYLGWKKAQLQADELRDLLTSKELIKLEEEKFELQIKKMETELKLKQKSLEVEEEEYKRLLREKDNTKLRRDIEDIKSRLDTNTSMKSGYSSPAVESKHNKDDSSSELEHPTPSSDSASAWNEKLSKWLLGQWDNLAQWAVGWWKGEK